MAGELSDRVAAVERRCRRLEVGAVAAACLAAAAALFALGRSFVPTDKNPWFDSIDTFRLTVWGHDAAGKPVVVLHLPSDDPTGRPPR